MPAESFLLTIIDASQLVFTLITHNSARISSFSRHFQQNTDREHFLLSCGDVIMGGTQGRKRVWQKTLQHFVHSVHKFSGQRTRCETRRRAPSTRGSGDETTVSPHVMKGVIGTKLRGQGRGIFV